MPNYGLVLCAETSCTETFESETSCAKSFCAVPFCVHRSFQRKCFQQRCFVHRHFIHRRFVPRQCAFRDRGPLWPKRIVGREELDVVSVNFIFFNTGISYAKSYRCSGTCLLFDHPLAHIQGEEGSSFQHYVCNRMRRSSRAAVQKSPIFG